MIKINIRPLSVNNAWKGKRFKTDDYKQYEKDLGLLLPKDIKVKNGLQLEFGFSSKLSDIDNPVKPFIDILQKKYGFNDRDLTLLNIKKENVKKGEEYIKFMFI